jgi:hypothetical protein
LEFAAQHQKNHSTAQRQRTDVLLALGHGQGRVRILDCRLGAACRLAVEDIHRKRNKARPERPQEEKKETFEKRMAKGMFAGLR